MAVLSDHDLSTILRNELHDPFAVLGMHWEDRGISVRAFLPEARSVELRRHSSSCSVCSMTRVHDVGIFEAVLPNETAFFPYEFFIILHNGESKTIVDPYQFVPIMGEQARYFFNEGTYEHPYEDLGAHIRTINGIDGVLFAVWAPHAKRVSVVGAFNSWDGRRHPMRLLGASGIWELFIPGLEVGTIYKYEIKKRENDHLMLKADPYGFAQEPPPYHGSIVCNLDAFSWTDDAWMMARAKRPLLDQPMSIYEVHLASWRKSGPTPAQDFLSYRDMAHQLADYVNWLGFTHVELLPVQDHPYIPSWGYQVGGFYAPDHRFGSPHDFQYFVNYLHNRNIGVIIDWVPGHFPKDAFGLARFDGTPLYEYADPREGEHKDWGTLIFNFSKPEVQCFLIGNALYWLRKYHIDGLRVDAVASMLYRDYSRREGEWIPNKYGGRENLEAIAFLKRMNRLVHEQFPGVFTCAEESTAFPMVTRPPYVGGLGFTFKWNMGWMNDILRYFSKDPIYRKYHHNQLTFALWYAFSENFILVVSHDEVVHGKRSLLEKMPGDTWQKFANLRAFFGYQFGHPGKKLIFQGCEFGMHWEWDAMQSITWHILESEDDAALHRGVQRLIGDLNRLYTQQPAFWELDFVSDGFSWIDFQDASNSVISFLRFPKDRNCFLVFVCNFTPVVRHAYRIGVPRPGWYAEILNTDAVEYGGSGVGNLGGRASDEIPWHNQPYSLELTLPPLATEIFLWKKNPTTS